ncbi:hypothetical protein G6F56_011507 [Rhizopus delemar]|nr:hypothetical protein G6F56_011507 [Rhizopus delemar]
MSNNSSTSSELYRQEDIQMEELTTSPAVISPLENVNAAMEILTVRMTNLLNRTLDGNLSAGEKEQARLEYTQSIADLENCKKSKALLEGFPAPIAAEPRVSPWLVPTDLPLFQWGNQVVDSTKPVFNTVEEFITRFEIILRSHGQDLDSNWYRLLPRCLTSGQLDWFTEALGDKSDLCWKDAASKLLSNYGPDDALKEYNASNNLMNMRMEESESVEAYTERFQRTRIISNFPDDRFSAHLYANSLIPFLSYQVLIYFAECIPSMTSVEPVASKARNLSQHLLNNPHLVAGDRGVSAAVRGVILPPGAAALSRGSRSSRGSRGTVSANVSRSGLAKTAKC